MSLSLSVAMWSSLALCSFGLGEGEIAAIPHALGDSEPDDPSLIRAGPGRQIALDHSNLIARIFEFFRGQRTHSIAVRCWLAEGRKHLL
jgi:hypothetical protein